MNQCCVCDARKDDSVYAAVDGPLGGNFWLMYVNRNSQSSMICPDCAFLTTTFWKLPELYFAGDVRFDSPNSIAVKIKAAFSLNLHINKKDILEKFHHYNYLNTWKVYEKMLRVRYTWDDSIRPLNYKPLSGNFWFCETCTA